MPAKKKTEAAAADTEVKAADTEVKKTTKAAAKKTTTRKTTTKKAATAKKAAAKKTTELAVKPKAEVAVVEDKEINLAAVETKIADEAKDGAKVYDAIAEDTAALEKAEAAKAEEAKKAAEDKPVDLKAVEEKIADEAADGAKVYDAIAKDTEALEAKEEAAEEAKPAKKTTKKAAAKKPAAKKTTTKKAAAKKAEAAPVEEKPVDLAEVKENIADEAAAGAKIYDAIAEDTAKLEEAEAAKAEEAKKAEADKPVDLKAVEEKIADEAADGAKVYDAIAEDTAALEKAEGDKPVDLKAVEEKIADEAKDGAKVAEAIEEDTAKAEEKAAKKPAKKTAAKKAAPKKAAKKAVEPEIIFMDLTDEKLAGYEPYALETLLEMANALGIAKSLEGLKDELAICLDVPGYTEILVTENVSKDHGYTFADDGFDETVIPVLIAKVLETIPVKSSDNLTMAQDIEAAIKAELTDDPMANAELYHKLFDLVKHVLMVGQKQNLTTLEEVETVIPANLRALVEKYMDVAAAVLPSWQYNDVKYYEGFLYTVLSQFEDLADLQNRGMMDVADLYIKHGDYGRGDAEYNYILRENQIKDYIYFRFANVYRPIDLQKAKAIAGGALQYVDGRYTYYPNLIEILNA